MIPSYLFDNAFPNSLYDESVCQGGDFTQKMKSPGKTEFNITLFPAIHTHFLIIFFADKFEILSLAQRCQSIFLNMLRHDLYRILEIF